MKTGPYDQQELDFIAQHYPVKGGRWVAKQLGRPTHSVYERARASGITTRIPPKGRITTPEAALHLGLNPSTLWRLAEEAGVLQRNGRMRDGRAHSTSVPIAWVNELAKTIPTEHEDEYLDAGWYSVKATSEYTGLSLKTTYFALDGRGHAARFFDGARTALARSRTNHKRFVHPQDVETARVRKEHEARRAQRLVAIKSLGVELGQAPSTVRARAVRLGMRVELLMNAASRVMAYVSPEDAAVLLGQPARRAA